MNEYGSPYVIDNDDFQNLNLEESPPIVIEFSE
jgi:hypothetical protein